VTAGLGSITHRDVSLIVKLLDEYQCYFVKIDSPINGARDIANQLEKDPALFSFGFSTAAGNPLHISIAHIARLVAPIRPSSRLSFSIPARRLPRESRAGHLDVSA
jgi:tripartite-type tricarboxylate transporter receptor subunit TctC